MKKVDPLVSANIYDHVSASLTSWRIVQACVASSVIVSLFVCVVNKHKEGNLHFSCAFQQHKSS